MDENEGMNGAQRRERRRGIGPLTKLYYEDKGRKAGVQAANGVEERITLFLCLLILEHILAQGDGVCICSVQDDKEEVDCYDEVDQEVNV
jgi:hypothetical protein